MRYVARTWKTVLAWLRITDAHDGLLSLTNIAVMVAIVKLAMATDVSVSDLGALMIAMLAYGYKKYSAAQVVGGNVALESGVAEAKAAASQATSLATELKQMKAETQALIDSVRLGRR